MKPYVLFGFDPYYPDGGMNDFLGDFEHMEAIHSFIFQEMNVQYATLHVLDTQTAEVHVYERTDDYYAQTGTYAPEDLNRKEKEE